MALPIASAALYVLGLSFFQGFTQDLGLDETQFPITVDRTLFYGFFAVLDLGVEQIAPFLFAAEVIAFVAGGVLYISASHRFQEVVERMHNWGVKRQSSDKSDKSPEEISAFANFSLKMFLFAVIVFFVILGILLAGSLANNSGRAVAQKLLTNIEEGRQLQVELHIVGQAEPILSYPIICSSVHCAFLINHKTVVYSHEKIEKSVSTRTYGGINISSRNASS